MTVSPETPNAALIALTRFGLGPRPGDLKRVAGDPRGAVAAELATPGVALLNDPYLVSSSASSRAYLERRTLRKLLTGREVKQQLLVVEKTLRADGRLPPEKPEVAKQAAAGAGDDMGAMADGMAGGGRANKKGDGAKQADKRAATSTMAGEDSPDVPRAPSSQEAAARFVRMRKAEIGFVERWVLFWNNHLTVSVKGDNQVRWLGGAYDREAIRPNVLGRFEDLLIAATRHGAMIFYLDNQQSFGPNSSAGKNQKKGLNENHARELMELHTVGVDGGYAQADVIALAKALTGWRVGRQYDDPEIGVFRFAANAHEPGDQTIMGKVYPDGGVEQAEAALRDLARNPKTAAHIARRLAVAFVADTPPPALVERLTRTFLDTDGDLMSLAKTLIGADEAWAAPRTKMRNPQEFVFGCARVIDRQPEPQKLATALSALGQPLWGASSPKGYSLLGADWVAPDAQTNRLDFAVELAEDSAARIDPNALAEDLLGDAMSDETKTAVKRAGSREQALALLLMSPEMQRR